MGRKGKTSANIKTVIRNISDQYPFEPQKAAIIELIANSLDAKASVIEIDIRKEVGYISLKDNGFGMDKKLFSLYHNLETPKKKGTGIGFAGQGAKLGLNFCESILTETWSSNYRGYSLWELKGKDAPYEIIDGKNRTLDEIGTKVTFYLKKKYINYYNEDLIKEIIIEHYYPLVDPGIRKHYEQEGVYERGVNFVINGNVFLVEKSLSDLTDEDGIEEIEVKYKRKEAKGFFCKIKEGNNIEPGIMVCTFGKVIEREFFRQEPREKEKIFGWIEAPFLIEAVTTNKCKFKTDDIFWNNIYRKTRDEFKRWLEGIGLIEKYERKDIDYSEIEEEINKIIKEIPELSFFANFTDKDVAVKSEHGFPREMGRGIQIIHIGEGGSGTSGGIEVHPGSEEGVAPTLKGGDDEKAIVRRKRSKGSIFVTDVEKPDVDKESWFDGELVCINSAHPAYLKSRRKNLINYHVRKCIIISILEFGFSRERFKEFGEIFQLQERFFSYWGKH